MGTLGILIAVAVLIGLFSYFTNAGFGDRKPKNELPPKPKQNQLSAGEGEPPPSK
ncbi:MAG TPA: hypothetical protein VIA18_26660 [Polyangia bacterium]|jgi:hypothetical protein|nr:hypothetical protein [Polyangia bacterium]HWE26358.1 hypothetical protein [Polyangia bacterium]